MLKLIGGELYQWDKCRRIAVDDPEGKITDIHYARDCDNTCIVVSVKTDESGATYAEIPNILLQSFCPIYAYAVNVQDEERKTIAVTTFIVRQKAKPADYVYTETETLCYRELDKRLKNLEAVSTIYVHVTQDENGAFSADKTITELIAAYKAGCSLYAVVEIEGAPYIHNLFTVIESQYLIAVMFISATDLMGNSIITFQDNEVTHDIYSPTQGELTINDQTFGLDTPFDITSEVNALIDKKLGVIENGSY